MKLKRSHVAKIRNAEFVADQIPPFLAYVSSKRYAVKTVINYRYLLHAAQRAIGLPLIIASTDDIDGFMANLGRSKVRPATIAKYQASLRVFFKWAVRHGYAEHDPTLNLEAPKKGKRLPIYLTEPQVDQLLASLTGNRPHQRRDAAAVALLLYSGIRAGELVGLDVADLHFTDQQIRVIGKGDKERLVPLTANLRPYLDRLLAVHPTGSGALIVGTVKPHGRMPYDTWLRRFKALAAKAGLGELGLHPHVLRHTAATRWRRAGVPLEQIQLLLGHESVATTQIYAHGQLNDATRATLDSL